MIIIDVKHMVMDCILTEFPTDKVEFNLRHEASLQEDLGLTRKDIIWLGLSLERDLSRMGPVFFKDHDLLNWQTVQDVIDTIREIPFIQDVS